MLVGKEKCQSMNKEICHPVRTVAAKAADASLETTIMRVSAILFLLLVASAIAEIARKSLRRTA